MNVMLTRIVVLILVAAACGVQSAARAADDAPLEVAWTGSADPGPDILEAGNGPENGPDEVRLVSQDARGGDDASRFYVSKVLGTTFANIRISTVAPAHGPHAAWASPSSANASLFTAALVGGVRTPWEYGATRLECEGALRDNFVATGFSASGPAVNVRASDNWSLLANAWQDFPVTERLGVYAGGGVGGGGYRLTVTAPDGTTASAQPSLFTWQAGGGATLRYNSLIDLDMSYRFLSFAQASSTLTQPGVGGIGSVSSSMTAGELFFMLRVYEPFQWAKHLRSRDFYLPE
jgi:opacity protein-like surface antigen